KLEFSSQAGIQYVSPLGLQSVAIDPAIAAIIGRTTATTTFNTTFRIPMVEARITRRFDRASLDVGYALGAIPGNGVYLTSRQNVGTVTSSSVGFGGRTAGLGASYGTLSAMGQTLGKYSNFQGGGGLTYKILRDTHVEFRYDYRHYTTQNS